MVTLSFKNTETKTYFMHFAFLFHKSLNVAIKNQYSRFQSRALLAFPPFRQCDIFSSETHNNRRPFRFRFVDIQTRQTI